MEVVHLWETGKSTQRYDLYVANDYLSLLVLLHSYSTYYQSILVNNLLGYRELLRSLWQKWDTFLGRFTKTLAYFILSTQLNSNEIQAVGDVF